MARINVLPKSVAELIAAGEVVERPSSAVKELVENSVDAGATFVTVEIKNGGVKYIRVTDNGCGISREDVRTALISHATSKIKTGEDLDSIFTLGFRGEALPSIAAVSRLSMLTKTASEETGTRIDIEGGEETAFDEAGCPDGTTIIIRDLFYNTPARMKFLKKDMTEATYVNDIVAKIAIAHPEVRFIFIKDGKQILSTPGNGDVKDAVFAVFGKDITESLLPCDYEFKSIRISGYISRPLNNRPNRNMQYCYVNGRYVRMPVAAAALDEAYKNSIMVGKFPVCFLFIEIPAGSVDVNVHPAKTEIRFSEDSAVFEAIFYAAKSALGKGDFKRPEVLLRDKRDITAKAIPAAEQLSMTSKDAVRTAVISQGAFPFKNEIKSAEEKTPVSVPFSVNTDITEESGKTESESKEKDTIVSSADSGTDNAVLPESNKGDFAVCRDTTNIFKDFLSQDEIKKQNESIFTAQKASLDLKRKEKTDALSADNGITALPENGADENSAVEEGFRIVGEIFRTYILVERAEKLLIIDKHAAHERMIFNTLSERGFSVSSQVLLAPISVTLSGKEYAAVLENLEIFEKGGFCVEDFGGGCVLVRECPLTLHKEDIAAIVTEMAGELAKGNSRAVPEKLDWLYHSTACRAAVKAGDELKEEELKAFVEKLLADDKIRYCPHGRPVMYELSKYEIEKQFGRI